MRPFFKACSNLPFWLQRTLYPSHLNCVMIDLILGMSWTHPIFFLTLILHIHEVGLIIQTPWGVIIRISDHLCRRPSVVSNECYHWHISFPLLGYHYTSQPGTLLPSSQNQFTGHLLFETLSNSHRQNIIISSMFP